MEWILSEHHHQEIVLFPICISRRLSEHTLLLSAHLGKMARKPFVKIALATSVGASPAFFTAVQKWNIFEFCCLAPNTSDTWQHKNTEGKAGLFQKDYPIHHPCKKKSLQNSVQKLWEFRESFWGKAIKYPHQIEIQNWYVGITFGWPHIRH